MGVPALSVVVPCYNEADTIDLLYARLSTVCASVAPNDHEIVLVNDGSHDGTWEKMRTLLGQGEPVVCVNLSRNHGHQLALTAGLNVCRGGRVLIIDADLQDPPELLPDMMAIMDGGADVVYGVRRERAGETAFKRYSASIFYRMLARMVDVSIPVDTGDFRLISRRALDALNDMPERHRFLRGMVSWIGFHQEPIHYDRAPRAAGETKYPLVKMIRFALDAITGFSTVPLRLATYLGLSTILLAALLAIYVVSVWLAGGTVAGWSSVMIVLLFFTSIQLLVAGIIGEYIGRLFMESKRRPLYIIESVERPTTTSRPVSIADSDGAA